MAPIRDINEFVKRLVRLNLVTDAQARGALAEFSAKPAPEALCRALERRSLLTPYQSQKLLKGETGGFFLGGYRLLYRIASGSFGRVFRADDPRTGQVVAIKVLRKRWSEDAHKVGLFEREGRVGLTMRHPNVVQILAVSRDTPTGQHYIVMEFVEGGNLRDFLAIRKRLEPHEALRLLEETAAGLAYAYSRGLTHRDMKPTNVLISSQGTAKLVDFGLAELTGPAGADVDDDTAVDRSVDYAGLERATGVKAGDVRSDIYFLGAVFYEMLTGTPPLTVTKDRIARVSRDRFENLPSLRNEGLGAPPELYALVDKMLAFEPTARYQTPAQLLDAVRQVRAVMDDGPPSEILRPSETAGPPVVYVVEGHDSLRKSICERLASMGYHVESSGDPSLAVREFKQTPFQGLIVDAGSAGREGVMACNRILEQALNDGVMCGAVLILSDHQKEWAAKIAPRLNLAVMVRPVTLKQLLDRLAAVAPRPHSKKAT